MDTFLQPTHWPSNERTFLSMYLWWDPPNTPVCLLLVRATRLAIKQDCSSSFSGSAVSGDRWVAPGLESVVEQHLPWTLKPYKALYGSPEDEWGIFCVLLVVQVASNYFISQKSFSLEVCVCHIGRLKSLKVGNCVAFILLASSWHQ